MSLIMRKRGRLRLLQARPSHRHPTMAGCTLRVSKRTWSGEDGRAARPGGRREAKKHCSSKKRKNRSYRPSSSQRREAGEALVDRRTHGKVRGGWEGFFSGAGETLVLERVLVRGNGGLNPYIPQLAWCLHGRRCGAGVLRLLRAPHQHVRVQPAPTPTLRCGNSRRLPDLFLKTSSEDVALMSLKHNFWFSVNRRMHLFSGSSLWKGTMPFSYFAPFFKILIINGWSHANSFGLSLETIIEWTEG